MLIIEFFIVVICSASYIWLKVDDKRAKKRTHEKVSDAINNYKWFTSKFVSDQTEYEITGEVHQFLIDKRLRKEVNHELEAYYHESEHELKGRQIVPYSKSATIENLMVDMILARKYGYIRKHYCEVGYRACEYFLADWTRKNILGGIDRRLFALRIGDGPVREYFWEGSYAYYHYDSFQHAAVLTEA